MSTLVDTTSGRLTQPAPASHNSYVMECCPPALVDECSICETRTCSDGACGVEGVPCLEAPALSHCVGCQSECRGCVAELRTVREPETRADR